MIVNAPLAVQATKQSALQGLYFDEDLTRQLRAAVRELRQARRRRRRPGPRSQPSSRRSAASCARRSRRSRSSRARSSAPKTPRRVRGRSRRSGRRYGSPGDRGGHRPAVAVHHRRRGAHLASRRRRRRRRARAARDVGRGRAGRGGRRGRGPVCSSSSTACRSSTARRGSTTIAVARLAARLGADPAAPSLLRHRRHDDPTARRARRPSACSHGELDLALDHERGGAGDPARRTSKRGDRYPYSFKPAEKRPFPWESAPDPIEVAHEVFQAWLTFALFDNARRARLGIGTRRLSRRHRTRCSRR